MKQRIITAIVLMIIAIPCVVLGGYYFKALIGVVLALSVYEMLHICTRPRIKIYSYVIVLLFFGIFMIGTSSYGLYRNMNQDASSQSIPTITVEKSDDTTLLLKVIGENNIDTITYYWNNGEQNTINANDRKYIEQEINIPSGSNILNVEVTDVMGGQNTFSEQYEIDSNIQVEDLGNGNISITYEGDTQISYMTYRWDEEDETTVEINNTSFSQEIPARRGLHTLTVIVVDVDNKTETKIQEIQGIVEPSIEITTNEDFTKYLVTVSDEIGLSEVTIVMNNDDNQKVTQQLSGTEFNFSIDIVENSDNIMNVTVTNSSGIQATRTVRCSK